MKNIFQTWQDFSKDQTQFFKGDSSASWVDYAQDQTKNWFNETYPQGEAWRYVAFKQLPKTDLHWPESQKKNHQYLTPQSIDVEINNFNNIESNASTDLPDGLEILSERVYLERFGLENYRKIRQQPREDNPFGQAAASFLGQGLIVLLKKDFTESRPLRFILNYEENEGKDLYTHLNLTFVVDSLASPVVFFEQRAINYSGIVNCCVSVELVHGATFKIYNAETGGAQSHFFYNLTAHVGSDASFSHFDLTTPSWWSRHSLEVSLQEKGASTDLRGIYLNNGDNFVDHHTAIYHYQGSTTSFENYKGILTDHSKAVFNGKVLIAPGATQSNSQQINKNLMLSNSCEVDTKPELQIYNDDVKAAHGATVGQLDEEQRFYLLSRGYSPQQTSEVLARAFVFDLTEGDATGGVFLEPFINKALKELKES